MATTYEEVLHSAQQLTREEQAQLIEDLKDADDIAGKAAGEGRGSTGAPLNEPQPYSSPRSSSSQ